MNKLVTKITACAFLVLATSICKSADSTGSTPSASSGQVSQTQPEKVVVALVNDKKVEVGTPFLKAEVTAKVLSHGKGDKVVIFKYKPKKRESRKIGHRQPYTEIEITGIK